MSNDISIFSFFSGSGFLDLGFEKADFKICFVNELKSSFLDAYKYSRKVLGIHPPKYGYSGESVENYLSGEDAIYLKSCMLKEKEDHNIVGFIGGPPCPDFSVGGKNRGRHGDNGKLSGIYIDLICNNHPDFFVFENVKGLWRTKRHREFFEELKARLSDHGYIMSEKLVNSIEYGVPQDRDRIILFGVQKSSLQQGSPIESFNWNLKKRYNKEDVFNLPWPNSNPLNQNIKLSSSLPKELTVDYWFKKNDVENHPNSKDQFKPRAGLEKFLRIEEGDDSKKSFKRLHRNRYSPTVCYGNNEVHLHPTLPRRISVAEALALQSLPSNFELPSSMTLSDKFKTVGNGVPFLLAKGLAETIKYFIEKSMEV